MSQTIRFAQRVQPVRWKPLLNVLMINPVKLQSAIVLTQATLQLQLCPHVLDSLVQMALAAKLRALDGFHAHLVRSLNVLVECASVTRVFAQIQPMAAPGTSLFFATTRQLVSTMLRYVQTRPPPKLL